MPVALVLISGSFRDSSGSEYLSFATCVTLGMPFISSEAQFPYKQSRGYVKTDNILVRDK